MDSQLNKRRRIVNNVVHEDGHVEDVMLQGDLEPHPRGVCQPLTIQEARWGLNDYNAAGSTNWQSLAQVLRGETTSALGQTGWFRCYDLRNLVPHSPLRSYVVG